VTSSDVLLTSVISLVDIDSKHQLTMSRRSPDDVSEVLAEAHRRTSAAGGCTPLVGDRVRVAQAKLSAARRRYFQSEVVLCELDAILDNVGDVR
jgi:hypothetical protein